MYRYDARTCYYIYKASYRPYKAIVSPQEAIITSWWYLLTHQTQHGLMSGSPQDTDGLVVTFGKLVTF